MIRDARRGGEEYMLVLLAYAVQTCTSARAHLRAHRTVCIDTQTLSVDFSQKGSPARAGRAVAKFGGIRIRQLFIIDLCIYLVVCVFID